MTYDEAKQECARLAAEHPDRETHQWRPVEHPGGDWAVVKVGLAPQSEPGTAETRADEKPPTPDDPRSAAMRNLGPNVGPGF